MPREQQAHGSLEVTVLALHFVEQQGDHRKRETGGQPVNLFSPMPARWQFVASGGIQMGFSFLSSAEIFPCVNSVQHDRLHSKESLLN